MLERVLHNAEQCHTDFEVERIRRKLPLFVKSAAFPRAKKLLDAARIAVISGIPGIGKTTLAELLLYTHLEQGYQPIVIQGHISEGKKFFRKTEKQIFYYDDFLGQIFLGDRKEYLGRNEDAAIVDFMEMIQGSKHSRFILTTREHILRSALQVSEKFARSLLLKGRCILELEITLRPEGAYPSTITSISATYHSPIGRRCWRTGSFSMSSSMNISTPVSLSGYLRTDG